MIGGDLDGFIRSSFAHSTIDQRTNRLKAISLC
jgi:hypothetical protein